MARTSITIEGLDDCVKCLDRAPENLLKMSRKAMREAAKPVARVIRQQTPKRYRKLVRYKVVKMYSGNTNVLIGLFNGHQREGHQNTKTPVDDWFKAYWANYGTLTHRDSSHQFEYPVKKKTRYRRNDVGQPAQLFFEAAISSYEDTFIEAFQASLKDQEETLYDR